MSFVDELEKLERLRANGTLTTEEFQQAKKALLERERTVSERIMEGGESVVNGFESFVGDEKNYGMLLHLSMFCAYAAPLAGIVVPVVLWLMKKDESDVIDQHGRNVINWIITEIVLAVIFCLLSLILIGIPLLILLVIAAIACPIIGALKALDGEVWEYPGSFKIL